MDMIHKEDITLVRYYSYTSIVNDRICEYHYYHNDNEDGCQIAFYLYDMCVEIAKKQVGKDLYDNKSAFEILYKGRVLFVGHYDNMYSIGLSVSGIGGNRVYDFASRSYGEYGNHDA